MMQQTSLNILELQYWCIFYLINLNIIVFVEFKQGVFDHPLVDPIFIKFGDLPSRTTFI